ncbi:conserved hypothetical protein [Methanosarcina thermophila]|uniref:Uncharacterized protein n=1 Tax=Methanosarcina thermophila TaxID=2210 RepID=A0A3G9CVF6_METTE|nr:conserved hypothetical protein [Methanosarcina thermophila]
MFGALHIRMQDPLKQGLKQSGPSMYFTRIGIRMQDPLKQGLKLYKVKVETKFQPLFECKIH